jgi:hypothetical protein
VWHCHIVEHEDNDMMRPLNVQPNPSRLIYKEQPNGEWLRFATPLNSMIDSDKVPHLPKLGKSLGLFFIETYWSYPKAIFHPHNEFVFLLK